MARQQRNELEALRATISGRIYFTALSKAGVVLHNTYTHTQIHKHTHTHRYTHTHTDTQTHTHTGTHTHRYIPLFDLYIFAL